LCDDSLAHSATLTDPNPLIHCDLIESRDALLNFAHDNHCEFSTLRRAKYSTMFLLMKVQSLIVDEISYTCDLCSRPCNVRYHCKTREDYDLCTDCYTKVKREPSETFISIDTIHHAVLCQNANCTRCKWLIEHTRKCTKRPRKECLYCMKLFTYIWTHAKTCTDQSCRVRRKVLRSIFVIN
jgi:E1A/CREB-binding protein